MCATTNLPPNNSARPTFAPVLVLGWFAHAQRHVLHVPPWRAGTRRTSGTVQPKSGPAINLPGGGG